MKLFLMFLGLLAIICVCIFMRVAACRNNSVSTGNVRLVVIVKDQEPWVEGFIRKIFYRTMRCTQQVAVLLVDDCSRDGTPEIMSRLQKYYPFEVLFAGDGNDVDTILESTGVGNKFQDALLFDARGLNGKELLRAPLFSNLSC
ncbi:MAG: hypothetical protein A4E55_01146 [Pelotomaculum sp. PtaU1.Bin035]|nr:MAG: hypothetical protein A4E55_01146 [Pelotomaculum sp. PtaU1.Bin035]